MKAIMKKYRYSVIISLLMVLSVSCEDYLDQAPEASITENDIFTNFTDFQGFVEEMYYCITDWNKAGAWNPYLFADEVLNNYDYQFDRGNYWDQSRLFYGTRANPASDQPRDKRIWQLCWQGIRKANVALSKAEEYFQNAPQEEQDLIRGQALFFRGYFHFELMRWWGGMPYIDTLLSPTQDLKLARLTFQEGAIRAAEDLRKAADLLPLDWDDTVTGQRTLGFNQERIGKMHALGFLGKALLYAASPMMNEEATGNNSYNVELCKQAASVFAEGLKLCDETGRYKLNPWEKWDEIFWVNSTSAPSGGTERIMKAPHYNPGRTRWSTVEGTLWRELGASAACEVPTHNYVKNYAMASGLPISDPESGYDPNNPWVNREPRFYKDIIVDGDLVVYASAPEEDKYVQLFNGGRHRAGTWGSVTGYFYKRYTPIGCNKWDNWWTRLQAYVPFLRLADFYMEYAEAVLHGYGSPLSSAPGYSLTAVDAVNVIRNRAQLPNLVERYTADKDVFMEEIIRERAVEFAFNIHRFCDLRRWNLNHDIKYREKTAIDFNRGENGKPTDITERVVITRIAEKKHNWLPIQNDFTRLYPEFTQNPGW
jgi:hypothetical protein